jgi:N-acetyl-anhydromuramyl-L-alanine amidase AmpD
MREIRNIVIHCSATTNGGTVDRDTIDRWHREKGWRGIGYHYVIERDGRLAVGRPESMIGAHVAGENGSSIGICMTGTDRFSEAQWEALRDLCMDLAERYPKAEFWGHRDFSPDKDGDGVIELWEWFKTCPGFDVSAWRLSGMDPQWDVKHLLVNET